MKTRMLHRAGLLTCLTLVALPTSTCLSSCSSAAIANKGVSADASIIVEISPGPNYSNWGWAFIFPFQKGPQIAVWLETPDGQFVSTLYATEKSARGTWVGAPELGRPESLPVWLHARQRTISGADDNVDATAGATSMNQDTKVAGSTAILPKGQYVACAEVNLSYDWNAIWAKDLPPSDPHYNGVNGQPSLIYKGTINVGNGPMSVDLVPYGTGDALGRNGDIHPGLDGLDTALSILDRVRISTLK